VAKKITYHDHNLKSLLQLKVIMHYREIKRFKYNNNKNTIYAKNKIIKLFLNVMEDRKQLNIFY